MFYNFFTTTSIVALHCCNTVVLDLPKVEAHPVALLPQNLISLLLLLYCSFSPSGSALHSGAWSTSFAVPWTWKMSPQARSSTSRAMDLSALKTLQGVVLVDVLKVEANPLQQAIDLSALKRPQGREDPLPALDRTRELRANCRARKESNKQEQEKKRPKNPELFLQNL